MTPANAELIGVWDMLGEEDVDEQGNPLHPPVPRSGRLVYTSGGLVSVVSTPAVRARLAGVSPRPVIVGATDADLKAAVTGCAAYSGRYRVDGDMVTHIVEIALNPNAVGVELTRRFLIEGERMTFLAAPIGGGAALRIRWRRIG
ncbi:MAG: lipocalin-like domain-containing protein [Candidatus Sphingomonas phytovorans]|nr:lipocalin-like domain-containing protein [Sphingomonas sp.]WEK02294.1 MAG: lipocalin-like domain-containing protein [Sphingomonas sp.]